MASSVHWWLLRLNFFAALRKLGKSLFFECDYKLIIFELLMSSEFLNGVKQKYEGKTVRLLWQR